MDGNNIENNDDEQQQQQQQQQEQAEYEQEQQAAADEDALRRKGRVKLISVLEKTDEFSFRQRNKIDVLTERYLQDLENDIFDMLCEIDDGDSEDYRGLDSDRDTAQEVETAIRFFPDVLSRRKTIVLNDDDDDEFEDDEDVERSVHGFYPIQILSHYFEDDCWRCCVKAISFIPVLARLAIELGLFGKERGGLLCQDHDGGNVIQNLLYRDSFHTHNQDHREVYHLQVLTELRKMGLLKKIDIIRYNLLNLVCHQYYYFAEKQFRFLVEWDPNSLWKKNRYDGRLPLHHAALHRAMQGFQFVFEYGLFYFPNKEGFNLVFRQDMFGQTPFQLACEKHGRDQVMNVIEDTLTRYSPTPLDIADALMTAAIDENVHLDCVYFLLRRKPPDVLQELLSSMPAVLAVGSYNNSDDDDGGGGGDDDDEDEGNDGDSNVLVAESMNSFKKRKIE
jgi:hypothetical protein